MSAICLAVLLLLPTVIWSQSDFGEYPPLPSQGVRLYQGFGDVIIPDYYMITASSIIDHRVNSQGTNDGLWCQSSNNGSMIGAWYLPNGTQIGTEDFDNFPLHVGYTTGQVGLLRDGSVRDYEGLYTCIIPDEHNISQTLTVAIYRDTEYNSAVPPEIGNTNFYVLSTRDVDPPVIRFSFNVSQRPPTQINCNLNSNPLNIEIDRTVIQWTHPINVLVNVTLQTRLAGKYDCFVSNSRVDNSNVFPAQTSFTITVTDPPSNLTVVRVNLTAAILTWQPPALTNNNNVAVEGYEIFYESSINKLSDVVGNDTHEVIITFLQLNENYQMYVVAFGGDLPSTRSNAVNVSTEVNFYIPAVTPVIGETNVILSCRVTVNVPNLNFSVAWLDQEMNIIQSSNISGAYESTNSIANNTKSVSLKFDSIEPRDGGKYTCIANFLSFNSINESYYLFIQVSQPTINITILHGQVIYETDYALIKCSISLNDDYVVNVRWFEGNTLLESNNSYQINNVLSTAYTSVLNITSLSIAQNNTIYTCSFIIEVNSSQYVIPASVNRSTDPIIVNPLPTVNISFLTINNTTPILNEQFSITCLVSLQPELVEFLTIQWTHNGHSIIVDEHITQTKNSSTSAVLTFTSVQVRHLGTYTCSGISSIGDITIIGSNVYTLTITDPSPNVTVHLSPDEPLIEGTYIDLVCTSDIDRSINTVAVWSYNDQPLEFNRYNVSTNSEGSHLLRIRELMSRDNGANYTCTLSIVDDQYIVANSSLRNTITLSVMNFTSEHVTTFIEEFSTPTIGSVFTLECVIVTPARFLHKPNRVEWRSFNPLEESFVVIHEDSNITDNGRNFSAGLTFNPLTPANSERYNCLSIFDTFSVTNSSNTIDLLFILPPPLVHINASFPLYESTHVSLICTVTPPNGLVPGDVRFDINWIDPHGEIINPNNDRVVTTFYDLNSIALSFNPIDNGDNSPYNDTGEYNCSSTITTHVRNVQSYSSASVDINVLKLPPLELTLSSSGSAKFRHNLTLSCTVHPFQNIPLTVAWFDQEFNMIAMNSGDHEEIDLVIELTNLNYSMNGVYTCKANYSISLTNDAAITQEQYMLTVLPFGMPQNLSVNQVDPFSIQFTWLPPDPADGVFHRYQLCINNGSVILREELEKSQTNYSLNGLHPYQLVEINITAVFSIGEGTPAMLRVHTEQHVPGPVENMSVSIIYDEIVSINWSPVTQLNGIFRHYALWISEYERMNVFQENVTGLNFTGRLPSLMSGIPYVASVRVVNGVASSEPVQYVFFLKEESPLAVKNVTVSRINGTHVNIGWSLLSLYEAKGFVQNYTIEYMEIDDGMPHYDTIVIHSNQDNITITNLAPTSLYSVIIFASTNGGEGIRNEYTVDRPNTVNFQVRARPFLCDVNNEDVISFIRSQLTKVILEACNCNFTQNYISGEFLYCNSQFPMDVFYRANITSFSDANNSTILLNYIQAWLITSPNVTNDDNMIVTFDSSCPLQYNPNDANVCELPIDDASLIISLIIGITVLLIVIVVVPTVIILVIFCYFKKYKRYRSETFELTSTTSNTYLHTKNNPNDKIYEELDVVIENTAETSKRSSLPIINTEGQPRSTRSHSLFIPEKHRDSITKSPLPPVPGQRSLTNELLVSNQYEDSPILPPRNNRLKTLEPQPLKLRLVSGRSGSVPSTTTSFGESEIFINSAVNSPHGPSSLSVVSYRSSSKGTRNHSEHSEAISEPMYDSSLPSDPSSPTYEETGGILSPEYAIPLLIKQTNKESRNFNFDNKNLPKSSEHSMAEPQDYMIPSSLITSLPDVSTSNQKESVLDQAFIDEILGILSPKYMEPEPQMYLAPSSIKSTHPPIEIEEIKRFQGPQTFPSSAVVYPEEMPYYESCSQVFENVPAEPQDYENPILLVKK